MLTVLRLVSSECDSVPMFPFVWPDGYFKSSLKACLRSSLVGVKIYFLSKWPNMKKCKLCTRPNLSQASRTIDPPHVGACMS